MVLCTPPLCVQPQEQPLSRPLLFIQACSEATCPQPSSLGDTSRSWSRQAVTTCGQALVLWLRQGQKAMPYQTGGSAYFSGSAVCYARGPQELNHGTRA